MGYFQCLLVRPPSMITRTHFAHRIDRWDTEGNIVENLAGIEDYEIALAA